MILNIYKINRTNYPIMIKTDPLINCVKFKATKLTTMERRLMVSADWHHPATLPHKQPSKGYPSLIDDDTEGEVDAEVLVAEPEVIEPPMYAVVMYNDDYTPMEFVVYVLQAEFRHNTDEAVQIMLNIHNNGRGIAGIYPKDIAETKAKKVNQTARKEGYPLLTQIEPHQAE